MTGRERLVCVSPFSASEQRGRKRSSSRFLAPPHRHSCWTDIHWATWHWCSRSSLRKAAHVPGDEATPFLHGHTSQASPRPPPSSTAESALSLRSHSGACVLLSVPVGTAPKAGQLGSPGCFPATCSRSLTRQWLVTWTWSLLCVIYGCIGRQNRNAYREVQSHLPWKPLPWRVVMRVILLLSLIPVRL